MDWFDLFGVQGTLKSLLLHHSSKPSVLQHSAFFMVQLSNPYMTTGKLKVTQYCKSIMLFNFKKKERNRPTKQWDRIMSPEVEIYFELAGEKEDFLSIASVRKTGRPFGIKD